MATERSEETATCALAADYKEGALASAPAFFILVAVCLSLYMHERLTASVSVLISLFMMAALILSCTINIVRGWLPVFLIVILISGSCAVYSVNVIDREIKLPDSIVTEGKILSSKQVGHSSALTIKTPYGKFAGYVQNINAPREGSTIALRGALFDFKRAKKTGAFDEMMYWRARGAVKKIVLFEAREISPPSGIALWREKINKRIIECLPHLTAAYMSVFLVGRRDAQIEKVHRLTGTAHLLAVSGLHIWVIAGILLYAIRSNIARFFFITLLLTVYILLTGMPVSGMRAAIMVECMLAAAVFDRPYSSFNSVSIAAILLLMINPFYFWDIGWRLSVLCALFITASMPLMPYGLIYHAVLSVLLWFVTAPLLSSYFREVPFAGLLANAAAVPLFGLIFPLVIILSMPALMGLPYSGAASAASDAILLYFQRSLMKAAEIFPGEAMWSIYLYAASVFIFVAATALRCGAGIKRALFVSVFCLLFLLYCQSML